VAYDWKTKPFKMVFMIPQEQKVCLMAPFTITQVICVLFANLITNLVLCLQFVSFNTQINSSSKLSACCSLITSEEMGHA
jgi:hypothetical protein